jgi:phospholipid/cholesterol/gamma-HCH transport system substrate-binding protein
MTHTTKRALTGLATVAAIVTIVGVAIGLFFGRFTTRVPVTVLSPRAGLVMDPNAKVKLLGVPIGKVDSIQNRPDGQAEIHLAIDPGHLQHIPANVAVNITSTTVFGAKFVELVPPSEPSSTMLRPGQVLQAEHVTVEFNTIFEQLTTVLSKIQPAKLNETLHAIAQTLGGRGERIAQSFDDFDHLLARLEPSLPALSHDIEAAPTVVNAYADAAPDLMTSLAGATRISQTMVDQKDNLDAVLVGAIGLADIGNDVVGTNRQPLTDLLHILAPTTELFNQYNAALNCGLKSLITLQESPPSPVPGSLYLAGFDLGRERYRYPGNLPKVAATGGPRCEGLPKVGVNDRPPFVVADVGSNPAAYGNQGILLNADGLKQWLFGPIDGPPRNTQQYGQTG